jgi:hypothetical protein
MDNEATHSEAWRIASGVNPAPSITPSTGTM